MKNNIITCVLLISGFYSVYGQFVLKNTDDVNWYANIPQELVEVKYNASLLFTGESIYYKVYCKNAKTKLLSNNSKIAYIELIGNNGLVFRHRIRLEDGIGQGDFFIPVSVKTGNYQLIGYTRWMLNSAESNYYQSDISIVNPYAKIDFLERQENDSVISDVQLDPNPRISLMTNKNTYGKRELVNVIIESKDVNAIGNYAISVRKEDDIVVPEIGPQYVTGKSILSKQKAIGETIYLPEFKGAMITGWVKDKSTGTSAANIEVALSILGPEAIQDITKTNSKGIFYFQIPDNYRIPKALIQVVGDDRLDYVLEVDEHESIDYSNLKFPDLKLGIHLKEAIIERSVNNQIENAYISVKKDKIMVPEYPKPFFGNPMTTYKLDDYRRFKTVAETLDEVVDHAYHERRNGKTRYINVRERESDPYYDVDILPMVVVDGVSIQDHESILYYETKNVESMSVLRQEYYYGDKVYQGVLMINTINNDYYKNLKGDYLKLVDLESPQVTVDYFQQDYKNRIDLNRIPDQRSQLLWMPELVLKEKIHQIQFYTSDNPGTYQIDLSGFSNSGELISVKQSFEVD